MTSEVHVEALDSADHLRKFVHGSGVAATGLVVGGVLMLLTGVVFARWLKPEEFGTYSIAMALIALLGSLGAGGLDTAVSRFGSFYSGTGARALINPVIWFAVRWAIVLSVCLAGIAFWLAQVGNVLPSKLTPLRPLSLYIATAIPCFAVLLVLQQAILGLGAIKARMLVEKFVQPALRLLLPFVLIFVLRGRLTATVAGALLATITCVVVTGIVLKSLASEFPSGGKPTAREAREWSGYALPFALQSLQQFVSSGLGIDIVLIGVLASLSDSGIYAAAYRLTLLLTLIRSAMDYAFGPRVSALFGKGDIRTIEAIYKASSTLGLAFTLPLVVIFVLFNTLLMTTFFGLSYAEGSAALAWLVWGCLADSATGCNTTLLAMVGRSWLVLANGLLGGVLTVVFCVLFIPRFGISGAAFSVSAARVCVNGLATLELWKLQHTQPFTKHTGRLALPVAFAALMGLVLKSQLSSRLQPGLMGVVVVFVALLSAYAVGFRLAGLKWSRLLGTSLSV